MDKIIRYRGKKQLSIKPVIDRFFITFFLVPPDRECILQDDNAALVFLISNNCERPTMPVWALSLARICTTTLDSRRGSTPRFAGRKREKEKKGRTTRYTSQREGDFAMRRKGEEHARGAGNLRQRLITRVVTKVRNNSARGFSSNIKLFFRRASLILARMIK